MARRPGNRDNVKRTTLQPLHGKFHEYIAALDKVRDEVEAATITRQDLIAWYVRQFKTTENVAKPYINSLFRCGLLKDLKEAEGIECTFPKRRHKARRIIEIINKNIVFVLDMLYESSGGASNEQLHEVGKSKYDLGPKSNVNQIWWRRGWLESAGFLEIRDGLMCPTDAGLELLRNHRFDIASNLRGRGRGTVNPAEFGGKGEGREHKTLKEHVHKNCAKVLRAVRGRRVVVTECQMEYGLPSGDRVDVAAWDKEPVCWHMEVKSKISGAADIERGLYQCVKYKAVAEAVERVAPRGGRRVESFLVVEKDLPADLEDLAEKLQVRVHRVSVDMQRSLDRQRRDNQRA